MGISTSERKYVVHESVRPQAIEERLYQSRILETARSRNTLVVLPTALGKTLIALLLAVNRMKLGRVFFLAPTRPLVEQHHETFREKTLLKGEELSLITGRFPPEQRIALYGSARVVFATPQCVWNDVNAGTLNLGDVSLIIFDEAHRAVGNYAYVGIAGRYFEQGVQPLTMGLTASPGGREEKIVEVCRNLGVEAIEYRLDEDEDVKTYIQPIGMEWKRVKLPEAYVQVRDKLREMLVQRVRALQSMGVLGGREASRVTRRDLVELNDELQRRLGAGGGGYLYQLKITATAALSLMHAIELIETQGPETLAAFIENSLERMAAGRSRGHKSIVQDPLFEEVKRLLASSMMVENPKVHELLSLLTSQLGGNAGSRTIVFTQYRDTVNALLKRLKGIPGIRIARFVGQGFREGEPGMRQEEQREALSRLRMGELNVLVATCIAEEGLDIPEVDRVVFYEPVPSEIRYIQRRGRTGRRVAGNVTILLAEDTLDEGFYWSSVARARRMRRIIKALNAKLTRVPKRMPTLDRFARRGDEAKRIALAGRGPASPVRPKLWKPQGIEVKGSTQAVRWLMQNLPVEPTPVEDLVTRAVEETGVGKASVETAIWRLTQEGLLYQPEAGKIRRSVER